MNNGQAMMIAAEIANLREAINTQGDSLKQALVANQVHESVESLRKLAESLRKLAQDFHTHTTPYTGPIQNEE